MITRFITKRRERKVVLDWLEKEFKDYADAKFNENSEWLESADGDDEHTRAGLGPDSWWVRQINQYLSRAQTLGLETPAGRQAAFKSVTTAIGMLESIVRVYGPPPEAGHPSGTVITSG